MQFKWLLGVAAVGAACAGAGAQSAGSAGKVVYCRVAGASIQLVLTDGAFAGERSITIRGAGEAQLQPELSPDGKRVAFAIPGRTGDLDLYVANVDGTGARELVPDAGLPAWSPDGTRLLYVTSAIPPAIGVVNADGSLARQLAVGKLVSIAPFWSPDGKRIAFTAADRPDPKVADLYLANADGSDPQRLTDRQKLYFGGAGAWSPDGKTIALGAADLSLRKTELQLWDVATKKGRRVVDIGTSLPAGNPPLEAKRVMKTACWSPDGATLLATLSRGRQGRTDIGLFSLSPEGSILRRLTPENALCFAASWSAQ